jgi:hypothetical protein
MSSPKWTPGDEIDRKPVSTLAWSPPEWVVSDLILPKPGHYHRLMGSLLRKGFRITSCSFPPTVTATLLAQQASAAVMSVEDNIEYIRSQRAIFVRLDAQADAAIADYERQLAAATTDVNETNARLSPIPAMVVEQEDTNAKIGAYRHHLYRADSGRCGECPKRRRVRRPGTQQTDGSAAFIARLEDMTSRRLRPLKRGPKGRDEAQDGDAGE